MVVVFYYIRRVNVRIIIDHVVYISCKNSNAIIAVEQWSAQLQAFIKSNSNWLEMWTVDSHHDSFYAECIVHMIIIIDIVYSNYKNNYKLTLTAVMLGRPPSYRHQQLQITYHLRSVLLLSSSLCMIDFVT